MTAQLPHAPRLTGYIDPPKFNTSDMFRALVIEALAHQLSDLFVQPARPICARIHGKMMAMTYRPVDNEEVKRILKWAIGRDTAEADILSGKSLNDRYEVFDPTSRDTRGGQQRRRFRVNASPIQHGGATSVQIVMRSIPIEAPRYEDIGLTREIVDAATPANGIVYVAGSTGSGKTTTFAAIIRYILEHDTPIKGNLVTHEEPIEYPLDSIPSSHSVLVQSAVPVHFKSFLSANREAMRRAPGLVMVGEMRDEETIHAGIEAALTGHPVFATVHAINCAAVMRRLISRFPEQQRATAIFDLVETARFIMAQRLVMGVDGRLLAAREYLSFDSEVRESLIELTQMGRVTHRVQQLVEERGHSFQAEAQRLLAAGRINSHVARELAHA